MGFLIGIAFYRDTMRLCAFVTVLLATVGLTAVFGQTVPPPTLTDFQRETIASIREITLQLLLLAIGVFALMGGFAADKDKDFKCLPLGWVAFLALGLSVFFGLFTYGNLIYTLGNNTFDPFSQIRILAAGQWVSFGLGGLLFMFFVLLNMRRRS